MTKSQFLAQMEVMQAQGFEMFKAIFNELELTEEKSEKISIGSDVFKDLVSTIAEEVGGDATDMIDDYELEMYSNEVTISDLTLSTRKIQNIVEEVLERYFETKD